MAAGDIALRILVTAETATAINGIAGMGSSILKTLSGMGNGIGNIIFGFKNLQTSGTIGMDAIKLGATQVAGNLLKLGLILGSLAGIAVLAMGIAGAKAAGDFQAAMTRLVTSAGELPQNLKMVSAGILQMSVDTATSTDQLGKGMYYVESAGYHAADGLNVLKVAAMGAKSENADLDIVTKALTTEMVDYHMKSSDAAAAMNGLIATVQNGKTNLQDLASSMGAVLPIASSLGISFPQVAGAMDTMTNAGMTSRQAAMNLAHVLLSLSAPSGVAVKAMKGVGLSAQDVKDALIHKGLPEALQMIEDAVGKKFPKGSVAYETAIKNITGGIMGVKLAAMLTGPSLDQTQQNIAKVANAMNQGKSGVMGWTEVQGTFNFKLDQAKMAFQALLITLGTALLPILGNLLTSVSGLIGRFSSWITSGNAMQGVLGTVVSLATNLWNSLVNLGTAVFNLLNKSGLLQAILQGVGFAFGAVVMAATWLSNVLAGFLNWVSQNEVALAAFKAVLILLAAVIGTVLVIALYAYASAAFVAAAANIAAFWPVYLVIIIIVAIIAVVILAVQHWGQIMSWFGNIFSAIGTFVHGVITAIGNAFSALGTKAHQIWDAIAGFILGVFNRVHTVFAGIWGAILNVLLGIWNVIKMAAFVIFAIIVAIIIAPLTPLIDWFKSHWTQIHAVLTTIWNAIKAIATTIWTGIGNFFQMIGTNIHNFIMLIWNAISSFLLGQWNKVKNDATTIWNALSGVLSGIWNGIKGIATAVWNAISGAIMDKVHGLQTNLGNIWNNIKSAFSGIMNSLGGIAQGAWNSVVGIVKGAVNGLIGIINGMIDGVNSITSHVGIPAIPHIPYLASGGTNLPAGMYWVGEQGPELLWIPQGSTVLSNQQSTALVSRPGSYALAGRSGGGSGTLMIQPAPVMIDKQKIGEILFTHQANEIRRQRGVRGA